MTLRDMSVSFTTLLASLPTERSDSLPNNAHPTMLDPANNLLARD